MPPPKNRSLSILLQHIFWCAKLSAFLRQLYICVNVTHITTPLLRSPTIVTFLTTDCRERRLSSRRSLLKYRHGGRLATTGGFIVNSFACLATVRTSPTITRYFVTSKAKQSSQSAVLYKYYTFGNGLSYPHTPTSWINNYTCTVRARLPNIYGDIIGGFGLYLISGCTQWKGYFFDAENNSVLVV